MILLDGRPLAFCRGGLEPVLRHRLHAFAHDKITLTYFCLVPRRIRFKETTTSTMEKEGFNEVLIEPLKQFAKDSLHLVKKCTKPDRKEFTKIARATGVGFLIMGFIGFFVKLVHIPINNILVGN